MADLARAIERPGGPEAGAVGESSGETAPAAPSCRFCGEELTETFCDLGASPPANRFLRPEDLGAAEPTFPLHARVCGECFLVQLEQFQSPGEIFGDYAYFSSYSRTWLDHAAAFAEAATARFGLGPNSRVVEIASNDGYLLQYFRERGVPVLGIEPAANVAAVAEAKGIPSLKRFFGRALARELVAEGRRADLLIGNNVLAHVPDLNDFVAGLRDLLADDGILSMEFPHLLRLIEETQFDTIYHEHFSYFSFLTARRVFAAHGIRLFDVEELPTHGGSLRIFGCRAERPRPVTPAVAELAARERAAGLEEIETYRGFEPRVRRVKRRLLSFLIQARDAGRTVVGYGAPAKGNTLLNYCGIGRDFIDYTVDRSPHKQGLHLPGTRIPVHAPERIAETRPDYVLILPWNLRDEIRREAAFIAEWGGRFVVPIPEARIVP